MIDAAEFARVALALPGVASAPHFDRTAFRVKRIFATLAADGLTANLRLTPEEQALKCAAAPSIFSPLDNAWGRQGWTTMDLATADGDDLAAALALAHAGATGPARRSSAA